MHNNVKTPLRISSSWVKLLPRSDRPMSRVVEITMMNTAAANFGEVAENNNDKKRPHQGPESLMGRQATFVATLGERVKDQK